MNPLYFMGWRRPATANAAAAATKPGARKVRGVKKKGAR
jgi:hypothetical protein